MATGNQNITLKGEPLKVTGRELRVGDAVPDFVVTGNDMSDITLGQFAGKVLIILAVPSVDTSVCSVEGQRFNREISALSGGIAALLVSRDLPFAQQRWCGAEGVDRVVTASDYKHRSFGAAFGVDAEDIGLLARAVFVVGKDGKLAHVEYVPEIGQEPDYDAALSKAKELL